MRCYTSGGRHFARRGRLRVRRAVPTMGYSGAGDETDAVTGVTAQVRGI